MSRHADRQQLATEFGATDIVAERGDEGIERVMELTGGIGADAVLECVGTDDSVVQALRSARPGGDGRLGRRPARHRPAAGAHVLAERRAARRPRAGPRLPARPARAGAGTGGSSPGKVFDLTLPLTEVAEAYAAMDERRAIKVLLLP